MESGIAKHSVVIAGRRTSVSLEDEFWKSLRDIAKARHLTVQEQIASIDAARPRGRNLSSAIRLFVLDFYRDQLDNLDCRAGPEQVIGQSVSGF